MFDLLGTTEYQIDKQIRPIDINAAAVYESDMTETIICLVRFEIVICLKQKFALRVSDTYDIDKLGLKCVSIYSAY